MDPTLAGFAIAMSDHTFVRVWAGVWLIIMVMIWWWSEDDD